MSERSAKWLKKRSFLDQREAEVKSELSEASSTLESGVKKVLIATAAVGGVIATGYMLYRAFRPKRKPQVVPEPAKPQPVLPVRKHQKLSLKNAIIERLTLILVQAIGTQIALLLAKNKRNEPDQI